MNKTYRKYVLLALYLSLLAYGLFMGGDRGASFTGSYNLQFFSTIHRYFFNTGLLASKIFWVNIVGNVVVFIPLGFLLPLCFNGFRKWPKMFLFCILLLLSFESLQYLLKVGVFDVDDILLNTVGAAMGYLLYGWFQKYDKKRESV